MCVRVTIPRSRCSALELANQPVRIPIRKRIPWSATRGLGQPVVPLLLQSPGSQPKHTLEAMGCTEALQSILLSERRQGCGLELSHLMHHDLTQPPDWVNWVNPRQPPMFPSSWLG